MRKLRFHRQRMSASGFERAQIKRQIAVLVHPHIHIAAIQPHIGHIGTRADVQHHRRIFGKSGRHRKAAPVPAKLAGDVVIVGYGIALVQRIAAGKRFFPKAHQRCPGKGHADGAVIRGRIGMIPVFRHAPVFRIKRKLPCAV